LIHKPGDISTLTNHINTLVSNKQLKEKLKQNNLTQAINYTWSKSAEKLADIYHSNIDKDMK
jgi:glycosyltransferase involved in cell wall biosynthesis